MSYRAGNLFFIFIVIRTGMDTDSVPQKTLSTSFKANQFHSLNFVVISCLDF